jgi:hypothetical protein
MLAIFTSFRGEAMNFKEFSNDQLSNKIKFLSSEDRRITTELIECLREIRSRRIHLQLGYGSLFEYCVKELGFSEGSASRRVSAVNALEEMPEIKAKIESGALTLSNISQAQKYFRVEKEIGQSLNSEEKREVLKSLEHTSTREAERKLVELEPKLAIKEKERVVADDRIEIRFTMNTELKEKIEKIKSLLSHKKANMSFEEVLFEMAEVSLAKLDPEKKKDGPSKLRNASPAPGNSAKSSRYINVQTRQAVWKRDLGQCSFRSASGLRCSSRHRLEMDHCEPYGYGGANTVENLRLLCRAHHQLVSVQTLGAKMQRFL